MHDIDRVRLESQFEAETETTPSEIDHFLFPGFHGPGFQGHGFHGRGPFHHWEAETEPAPSEPGHHGIHHRHHHHLPGGVFGDTEHLELASELLETASEAELDRFIGDLIGRAGQAVGKLVNSPEGQAIGGILKGAAKQVLPGTGSEVGSHLGGTSGSKMGADAGAAAGRAFGLELEGLSSEDREFEIAKRFVDFAGEAVRNLASAPSSRDPRRAANAAAVAAAKASAPGLLAPPPGETSAQTDSPHPADAPLPTGNSGRWVRRGNRIVLYGI